MTRQVAVVLAVGLFIAQGALGAHVIQEAAQQPEEATVVGCLQAGANDGEFVVAIDEKTTYEVQAAEGVDLAAHVNHRVELSGTIEKTESKTIFKAKGLKMVSTSCAG